MDLEQSNKIPGNSHGEVLYQLTKQSLIPTNWNVVRLIIGLLLVCCSPIYAKTKLPCPFNLSWGQSPEQVINWAEEGQYVTNWTQNPTITESAITVSQPNNQKFENKEFNKVKFWFNNNKLTEIQIHFDYANNSTKNIKSFFRKRKLNISKKFNQPILIKEQNNNGIETQIHQWELGPGLFIKSITSYNPISFNNKHYSKTVISYRNNNIK